MNKKNLILLQLLISILTFALPLAAKANPEKERAAAEKRFLENYEEFFAKSSILKNFSSAEQIQMRNRKTMKRVEPKSRTRKWRAREESNLRPSAPEADALSN